MFIAIVSSRMRTICAGSLQVLHFFIFVSSTGADVQPRQFCFSCSQLLPYVAGIVQLLNDYFRICKFSDLKIKAYSIVKVLLMSMGTGMEQHIQKLSNAHVPNNLMLFMFNCCLLTLSYHT